MPPGGLQALSKTQHKSWLIHMRPQGPAIGRCRCPAPASDGLGVLDQLRDYDEVLLEGRVALSDGSRRVNESSNTHFHLLACLSST